jgi:SAM-dependent methyltransferase
MDDLKTRIQVTTDTYRKIYGSYSQRNVMNDDVKKNLDNFISMLKGEKVLDVGCANGRESSYLYEHGLDVTGIDITPEFVEASRESCRNCKFILMDMTNLNFPRKVKFDGVWMNASFLHIPKKIAVDTLKNISKLIKDGGLLYVSVMEGNSDDYRENKKEGWDVRHFSDYSYNEFNKVLLDSGFEIIKYIRVDIPNHLPMLHFFANKL